MGRVIIIALSIMVWFNQSLPAAQVPVPISRLAYDRLYFESGTEKLIYPGCPFYILKKDDTVYSGKIEQSILGVSYSETTDRFLDTLDINKLRGIIVNADIDSLTDITISLANSEYIDMLDIRYQAEFSSFRQETNNYTTLHGNTLRFNANTQHYQLLSGTSAPVPDLSISYQSPDNKNTIRLPAHYIAVLMPNPSHEINRNNYIATSLYYRYDPAKLPFMIEADQVAAINCLYPAATACQREYQFDPQRGKQILNYMKIPPKEMSLAVSHPSLLPAARFFADLLSRDRVKVHIIDELHDADLTLRYIPFVESQPEAGLAYIVSLLNEIPSLPQTRQEDLRQLKNHVNAVKEVVSDNFRNYYYNLIDYTLKYSFGIFPLFQPTVALQFQPALKIDDSALEKNIVDFTRLTKIQYPESLSGDSK